MTEPLEQTSRTSSSSLAGTPRWVKVFAIALLALVVLVVVMEVGGNGLRRHRPSPNGMQSGEQRPFGDHAPGHLTQPTGITGPGGHRPFGGQPSGRQTPSSSAIESEVQGG
jgi:hypothetical protein